MVNMNRLGGLIPALATPIDSDGGIDRTATDRIVERCLTAGVSGVSPCGSTGEGWRLSAAQRQDMVTAVRETVQDSVPVIAGVPVTSVPEARTEIAQIADRGASAALVSPPGYLPITADDQRRLFHELSESSRLPIVLYNVPGVSGVTIPAQLVAELAGHPQVIGIKDSSRDLEYLQSVIWATAKHRAGFSILTGTDPLLINSLQSGADGAIAASVGAVPEMAAAITAALHNGHIDKAWHAQQQLTEVIAMARSMQNPLGWKTALAARGLARPVLVPPGGTAEPAAVDQFRTLLRRIGIAGEDSVTGADR